jgi:hypothetical protein
MDPADLPDDDFSAEIATRLVLDRWAEYEDDPDLSPAQRLDAIGADLPGLRDIATAIRALAIAVAAGSTPEAAAARVAAGEATQKAREHRFRNGARAVDRRIDLRKAADKLEKERRELAWREDAFARLEGSDVPGGERLIAEGALLVARERVREAGRMVKALGGGE